MMWKTGSRRRPHATAAAKIELAQAMRSPFSVIALSELVHEDRFILETLSRGQVQRVFLGDYTAVCRILGRYKFYIDTRDRGFGTNILLDGFWEMWLTKFIAGIVRPGMVAIDVGANFGYYTLLLADLVGPTGRVISVEPNPSVVHHLRNSIALNGFGQRAQIVAAAAGADCNGDVHLLTPTGEPKNARVVDNAAGAQAVDGTVHVVRQVSIDSIINPEQKVDFLKIDAEGAEAAIISGMIGVLERDKPALVLEFNAAHGAALAVYLVAPCHGRYHHATCYISPSLLLSTKVLS
jgi:FkbM family methyltransferase